MKVVAKADEKWYDKPISRRDFIKKAGMMGAGATFWWDFTQGCSSPRRRQPSHSILW